MEDSHTADSLALMPMIYLPILPRSPRIIAPVSFTGPGKTLHEIYCALGDRAEKHANRAAYSLGLGPAAVAKRIRLFFGDGSQRESTLAQLREGISRKLEKDCGRLVQYALPSETSGTQFEAFKSLVALTTRYPGLRRIFLDSESLQNAGKHESGIALLWDRPDGVCGPQWHFHRNFAAACMADVDISSMIEDSPIQSLGSVSEGLSIIERLLITSDCEGNSIFSRFIAIRYLGGILDLPPFWLQSGTMYRAIVQKLLTRATLLLKDLGLDSGPDDSMLGVPSDIEGVDILFEVILARIQTWVPNRSSSGITSEVWYPSLCHAVQLLRRPTMENILPRSWALVTGGKLRELVASEYEAGVVDIISATELFSDQVERLYEHWAPPPPRQKELELKERLKKRVLQYGTVTCTLLKDVSNASNQRYLPAIASVSLLIMETVQQLKDNEEICVEMVERSYEIVFAIINICRDPQEAPSPAIICNIIQFSETLEKILAFVRSQVKGGIWRSLIPSLADKVLLKACNAGLKRALDVFGVQPGIIMRIAEIQKDATQRHEELMAILHKGRSRPKRPWYRPSLSSSHKSAHIATGATVSDVSHDPAISKRFGVHRCWVKCKGASDGKQLVVASITIHLGLASTRKKPITRYLSDIATEETPVLFVLD